MSDKSQEVFRRIDLRWDDLRHEYASRLVEHGVPLAQVRDLLGHASITTTERYAAKLERGLGFGITASAGAASVDAEVGSSGKVADRPPSRKATADKSGGATATTQRAASAAGLVAPKLTAETGKRRRDF